LDLSPIETDRQAAIESHRHDGYFYEDGPVSPWPRLLVMLDAAHDNWERKVRQDGIRIRQSIRFDIYPKLGLNGGVPDVSQGVDRYQLFSSADTHTGDLIIHIDQRALFGCLTRRLVWNGVLGTQCLYERRPNIHHPSDIFSINFLTLSNQQIIDLKPNQKSS
jgi:hypothetical protein